MIKEASSHLRIVNYVIFKKLNFHVSVFPSFMDFIEQKKIKMKVKIKKSKKSETKQ